MRLRPMALALAALLAVGGCGSPQAQTGWAIRSGNAQVQQAFQSGESLVAVDLFNASKPQLLQLTKVGMDIWVHSAQVEGKVSRVRGTLTRDAWDLVRQWGLSVVRLPSIRGLNTFDKGYRTYEQGTAELRDLARRHPDRCSLVELGKSVEGRPILTLRVGKGDGSQKPSVLFTGENHARELVTAEIVMNLGRWLVEEYGKDPEATFAVENREVWVTPFVNPDGRVRAEKGLDWRKNANPAYGGSGQAPAGIGVDLNRNYDDRNWGSTGTDHRPGGATYGGPGPFTEPETQAMQKLYTSRKHAMLISWHSFGNLVMWPWNDSDEAPADDRLPAIGKKLGQAAGYKPEQGSELYFTSGDDTDYVYGKLGMPGFTIEVGSWSDGFDPPFRKMPQFMKENLPLAKLALALADNLGAAKGPDIGLAGSRTARRVVPTAIGRDLEIAQAVDPRTGLAGVPHISWAR
ncbi:MAG: M14 family metallopeptidase [Candidatus Sericytochromatia bacterium]|nr:M14 family metallopeptidase [Candidatus Sericytochromatia bacterium]